MVLVVPESHAEKVADLFLIRGLGGAVGVVTAEGLAVAARNGLQLQPAGPGNYVTLAAEGAVKAILGIAEAYAADAIRGHYGDAPGTPGHYAGEFFDFVAAGSIVSIFIDIARTLGISPLGSAYAYGGLGHVRPPMAQALPLGYGPRPAAAPAGYGMSAAPGYATRDTIPVGVQAQVTAMPRQTLRPGQSIATAFPRTMVS